MKENDILIQVINASLVSFDSGLIDLFVPCSVIISIGFLQSTFRKNLPLLAMINQFVVTNCSKERPGSIVT